MNFIPKDKESLTTIKAVMNCVKALLQNPVASRFIKRSTLLLQNASACLLQNTSKVVGKKLINRKNDSYYI